MSNDLALKVTWCGLNGKLAFERLQLKEVVVGKFYNYIKAFKEELCRIYVLCRRPFMCVTYCISWLKTKRIQYRGCQLLSLCPVMRYLLG